MEALTCVPSIIHFTTQHTDPSDWNDSGEIWTGPSGSTVNMIIHPVFAPGIFYRKKVHVGVKV